jgi:hypothetical protein
MKQVSERISPGQMKRLQVLYHQLCAHTQQGKDRASRIAWAEASVGRPLASFQDLTGAEARRLIDSAQGQLGVSYPAQLRMSREAADRHGRDGRRDGDDLRSAPQMVSAADLETIENYYARLGWNRSRFDAWLRSPSSPLKSASPSIRTKADANRVRWALKGMLQNAGLWEARKPA